LRRPDHGHDARPNRRWQRRPGNRNSLEIEVILGASAATILPD
jgi:hypothetical protein